MFHKPKPRPIVRRPEAVWEFQDEHVHGEEAVKTHRLTQKRGSRPRSSSTLLTAPLAAWLGEHDAPGASYRGSRLSTGAMEAVVAEHPDVAECAVIGVADAIKGQVPVALVVLKAGADRDPQEVERELVRSVREEVGAVASMKRVAVVARLPKTRSGKILRATRSAAAPTRSRAPSTTPRSWTSWGRPSQPTT